MGNAYILSSLIGKEGKVTIPALGVTIGVMANWQLKRRGDGGPKEGSYDLRAALSYANPVLFDHPEWSSKKEIVVVVNRHNQYRLEDAEARLDGNVLTMEGATLCRL